MKRTTLGRTGLSVSVAGLGCGGPSRLGRSTGADDDNAKRIVRAALDAGVNFIDTAVAYGTEEIVGRALEGRRDEAVISTKIPVNPKVGTPPVKRGVMTAADFREAVDASLRRLATDRIDILHLHGVPPSVYRETRDTLAPELERAREAGKIRFIGITEQFAADTTHEMLDQALDDPFWDVVMVGFNVFNQSAREKVFPRTREKGIGTLCMFAVRRAISRPDNLRALVADLLAGGELDPARIDPDDPLGFLADASGTPALVDAAYRYCRHEPGIDVVLTGTGSLEHLAENLRSIQAEPLSQAAVARAAALFGHLDSVSGN